MSPLKSLCALLALAAALALPGCGIPASCETQSECPQATVCALSVCRLECPCGEGEQCVAGACYAAQCEAGVTCAAGTVCVGETCGDPQCGGQDCGAKVCDPATQQCVQCLGDAQCEALAPTCQDGACVCIKRAEAELNCGDGRDDNCDGRMDCADETYCKDRPCANNTGTCRGSTCCIPTEQIETQCSDGIDNDCDGNADCADLNCANVSCSDACENPAVCTAGVCPDNGLRTQGTECRAAQGACDSAETCSGTSGQCPPDALSPSTRVCRPAGAGLACDAAETCTGTSRDCPADGVRPAGAECRPSVDPACDVADLCDGASAVCPQDQVRAEGTACKGAGNDRACDAPDSCDGRGHCLDRYLSAGIPCRPSEDPRCDSTESCTGSSGECPPDAHIPAGENCTPDASNCTTEVCQADKKCATGTVPDNGACLDGSGQACCGGAPACFDLQTDERHCGACAIACDMGTTCTDGLCCEHCEDDPPGIQCCGTHRCVMKGPTTNRVEVCE